MAGINFVRRWVMSQMTKKADDGIMITLPDSSKVDLNVNITMDRLLRNGFDPDAFTNPQQVDNAVNMINSRIVERAIPANSAEGREITEKIFGKQKAPVFDLEGNRIPEGSGIMGGKAVKDLMDSGQVTKGARGMKKSKKVEDREMFQKSNLNKTEAQLKKEIEASNKKGIAGIKNKRQLTEDEYQDFLDEVGGADQLEAYNFDGTVGDAKRIVKEQKDYMSQMEMEFRKGKLDPEPGSRTPQRKRFLQKKLEEAEASGDARLLSREEREELFDLDDIPEYAKGGRIGYAGGSDMGTVADSKGKTGPSKGGYQGGGTGPVERPSGGGGNNNNDNNNNPPPVSTNNTPPDTTFFDKTSKSGLMSNISPSILARLARIKKDYSILGEDVGLQYQNIDEINDIFTNFRITQDLEDLIKTKKLEPELKYRKEIGDNTLIEGGINQAGDANIMFKKQFADGGRANFVGGGMGRRGFLKMLAGLGGGIAAAKTGLLKFAGKEPAKQVAKEVVKQSAGTPPPYFFKLAEKIKKLGSDTTPTNDRTIAKSLKSKDGKSDYILEEDVTSGDTIIKKVNKEGDEMITDVQIMEFRKGEIVKGKDGKAMKTPDEYEEVTEANARIEGDTFNDPYYSDGIEIDDILREVDDIPVPKASGGIARLGYQVGGDVSYDATDSIYGSSAATFTPDTVMDQFGNQVQAEMGNNFNKPLIPQVTDQAANKEGIMNSSPVVSQAGGTGEIDMPIAGGNNNEMGILPVMPQDGSPKDARFRDPGPGIGTGGKLEAVKYNDPLPKDQLMSGFKEYVRNNPYSGAGTTAIKKAILPGGYEYTFSGSQEANKFNEYLASIGQAPYQAQQDPTMLVKFASGGIARMLGE